MPITQQRMIALITAARDYQDALAISYERLRQAQTEATNPQVKQALSSLIHETNPLGLLRDPINSALVIAKEETHFSKYHHVNTQSAKRQAAKRPTAGSRQQDFGLQPSVRVIPGPKRTTAPDSMIRRGTLVGSIQDQIEQEISGLTPETVPGLFDPPEAGSPESLGIGTHLDTATRAAIDQEIEEELRRRELGLDDE